MTMRTTSTFQRVLERAAEQHGFIRTEDLEELEVPANYLRKLAVRGAAEQRARGLYRLPMLPITQYDEFHEAVLWAGTQAVIGGEAALALWDLADVNPRHIDVVMPKGTRLRRKAERRFEVTERNFASRDIEFVDNVPVLTPAAAIDQAIDEGLEASMIEQAIATARQRGQMKPLDEARLRIKLDNRKHERAIPSGRKVPA